MKSGGKGVEVEKPWTMRYHIIHGHTRQKYEHVTNSYREHLIILVGT